MSLSSAVSVAATLTLSDAKCVLTFDSLNVSEIIRTVEDRRAGATAVFVGTTRDSFKGKVVTRLEYQAYSKLALKTLESIIVATKQRISRSDHAPMSGKVSSLIHCTIHHRLGTVAVGEPSIVIAVSSPHRKEAFDACEYILEEVKLKAQIWKREYYEGEDEEDAEWKANSG